MTRTPLYLDDLSPGQVFRSEAVFAVDETAIKNFACQFDPQPFHLDDAAAKETVFGGLAASGWHTAAMTMHLLVTGGLPLAGGIIGAGMDELLWPKPVRPGDRLRVESEVVEVRPSKSRPSQGLVKMRTTTLNQNGEFSANSGRQPTGAALAGLGDFVSRIMSAFGRFCCRSRLMIAAGDDSVLLTQFVTEARDDGAAQSRPEAAVLFVLP